MLYTPDLSRRPTRKRQRALGELSLQLPDDLQEMIMQEYRAHLHKRMLNREFAKSVEQSIVLHCNDGVGLSPLNYWFCSSFYLRCKRIARFWRSTYF